MIGDVGLLIGQVVTLLVSCIAIITALINKKARTPADDQARIAFGVSILEKQLERSQLDAARWIQVEEFLRGQIARAEGKADEAEALLEQVRDQVREVTRERDELQRRLTKLAGKHTRNETITLEDILGSPATDLQPTPI